MADKLPIEKTIEKKEEDQRGEDKATSRKLCNSDCNDNNDEDSNVRYNDEDKGNALCDIPNEDDEAIADDFITYITDFVSDDLIEGIVEKINDEADLKTLIPTRVGSNVTLRKEDTTVVSAIKTSDEADENDGGETLRNKALPEKKLSTSEPLSDKDRAEKSLHEFTDYINTSVTDNLLSCATENMAKFATRKIVDQLLEFIAECVVDDVIEAAVKSVSRTVASNITDQLTEFITAFICDDEILQVVLKLTGMKVMHETNGSKVGTIGKPIDYLTPTYLKKFGAGKGDQIDVCEPLTEQLMDSISNRVINEIVDTVTQETTNHLTDYVIEFITEDIMDDSEEDFSDCISKDSARTFCNDSDESDAATYTNEGDSDTHVEDSDSGDSQDEAWKELWDESDVLEPIVPQLSFFSYVRIEPQTTILMNEPRHQPLEELLTEMVNNNLGATIRVKIAERTFDCIASLLKVNSTWFSGQNWHIEFFEFNPRDVSAQAFEVIYQWMRFATPVLVNDAVQVLQASRHLEIDLLQGDCWDLLSQLHIREKLAFRVFLEADAMPLLDDLGEVLMCRVRGYFLALVGSEDFMNLRLEQVTNLLNRDSIGVNSEVEVFFAAVRWLSKSDERLKHIKTLMSYVRFAYVPMPMLFSIRNMGMSQEKQPEGSSERVMQEFQAHSDLTKKLYDAMTFISLHFQKELDGESSEPGTDHTGKRIYPRRWIYHPHCPYHKQRLMYPYQHNLTQADFTKYIASIQEDWAGDEPPENYCLDVEFDGAIYSSPKKTEKADTQT